MVNQYASLLLNLPGENREGGEKSYFVNRNYSPVTLPIDLQQFYNILFPSGTSNYQKQFLCYSYLRILESTGLTDVLYGLDSRVTYDLNELKEYFRINLVSSPTTTNINFNVSVSGEYTRTNKNNYYYNSFTISQVGDTSNVTVRSDVDRVYLNGFTTSQAINSEVTIPVNYSTSEGMSEIIQIGGTGLSFVITGPLNLFTHTTNKSWNFIAEAPFVFDFPTFFNTLKTRQSTVDYMLGYSSPDSTKTNENLWNRHFNDLYRFAGLLNCYVQRVNALE